MKQYGPADLTKEVAVLDDLKSVVICVPELPDPSTVTENTVMKLTTSQKGYCATHLYRMREGKWVDITVGYGPSENDFEGTEFNSELDSTLTCTVDGNQITLQTSGNRGDFLRLIERKSGDLRCCLVLRKVGSKPINCSDGEFVAVLSPDVLDGDFTNGQSVAVYKLPEPQYEYAAFEVFGTNWAINANCTVV